MTPVSSPLKSTAAAILAISFFATAASAQQRRAGRGRAVSAPGSAAAEAIALKVAPHALKGTALPISATLANAADCTLWIDGKEAGRKSATADQAGSFGCSFVQTFSAAGVKEIAVTAGRDRSASMVEVYATAEAMGAWRADEWEDTMVSTTLTETPGYRYVTETKAQYGTGSYNTAVVGLLDLDSLRLSYSEATDGKSVVDLADVPLEFSPTETDRRCVYGPAGAVSVKVCRKESAGITTIAITRESKDVVFHSEESGKPNVDTHELSGTQTRLGATATMNVMLSDGMRAWSAAPSMTLVAVERSGNEPRCTTTAAGQTCTQNTLQGVSKSGFASATIAE